MAWQLRGSSQGSGHGLQQLGCQCQASSCGGVDYREQGFRRDFCDEGLEFGSSVKCLGEGKTQIENRRASTASTPRHPAPWTSLAQASLSVQRPQVDGIIRGFMIASKKPHGAIGAHHSGMTMSRRGPRWLPRYLGPADELPRLLGGLAPQLSPREISCYSRSRREPP